MTFLLRVVSLPDTLMVYSYHIIVQYPESSLSQLVISPRGSKSAVLILGKPKSPNHVTLSLQNSGSFEITQNGEVFLSLADDELHMKHVNARSLASKHGLTVNGISQWTLTHHDMFLEGKNQHDWITTTSRILNCAGLNILTGSPAAEDSFELLDDEETPRILLSKDFTIAPGVTAIRIVATVHYIDDWQGETAFLKVNGEYIWASSHQVHGSNGLNLCGGVDYPEERFSVPLDVIFSLAGDSLEEVKVEIGSNVSPSAQAHFGLSSLEIYTRFGVSNQGEHSK